MISVLVLPRDLRAEVEEEARAAWPRECCGLIEGEVYGEQARVIALHPMRNMAEDADAFAIDPVEHIALRRRLRGSGRAIIGCYHSHPDGEPEPSQRDRAMAGELDFIWLIAACGKTSGFGAFVARDDGLAPLALQDDTSSSTAPIFHAAERSGPAQGQAI